jgi:hypothetical protein
MPTLTIFAAFAHITVACIEMIVSGYWEEYGMQKPLYALLKALKPLHPARNNSKHQLKSAYWQLMRKT